MGEPYQNTISGLLKKRRSLMDDTSRLRAELACVANDIESIDRVLDSLGYDGTLPEKTVRTPRVVMFHRNELSRFILECLRDAGQPLTSRDIAEQIVTLEGKDKYDHRLMCDLVKRVGKSARQLRDRGLVCGTKDEHRQYVWELAR